jgi:hypothetical protein
VKSAAEDNLGLVQWDLGVLLNCLYVTLKALENYVARLPSWQKHTPRAFLGQKHITIEQDVLIKSIKLAVCDIVNRFGPHLDQIGLDNDVAEACQKVWDGEFI